MKKSRLAILSDLRTGKSAVATILLLLMLSVFSIAAHYQEENTSATGQPLGVVSSSLNPLQVALLHWYGANQTTSFAAGSGPFGVAFDGENIWVSSSTPQKSPRYARTTAQA